MIEINLLPGAGKKSRAKAGGPDVGSKVAGAVSQLKEPFLMLVVASLVLSGGVIGFMYTRQQAAGEELTAIEQKQVQDSTRYAAVLREKKKAETQRDSVMHQLNIIKTIDNNRFV